MKNYLNHLANYSQSIIQSSPFWKSPVGWCSILTFHRVVEREILLPGIEINFKKFKSFIKYLKESDFEIISIDELNNIISKGVIPNRKQIVLTFDDGYIDNYKIVYPYLSELQIPFTIYVCNGLINKSIYIWWYLILNLYDLQKKTLTINGEQFKLKTSNKSKIFNFLRCQDEKSLKSLLLNLEIDINESYKLFNEEISMTWDQISELSKSKYVTIGAHTLNHYGLKFLSDKSSYNEMLFSKHEIEKYIEKKVYHFAYPFGSHKEVSRREILFAKEIGFKTALTTYNTNLTNHDHIDCHSLPRLVINGDININEFKLRLNGTYSFFNNIKNKIRF